jgi:hypothetical protein
LQQSGSFSNSSLNGTGIYYQVGFDCSLTGGQGGSSNCYFNQASSNTLLARLSANGGGGASGTYYSNSNGTIQTGSLTGTTYTVDSNGRAVMSVPGADSQLLYLVGSNHAWGLGADNGTSMGAFEAQTATSVSGSYAVGPINPVVPSGLDAGVATIGSGNVSLTQDHNDPQNGPQAGQGLSANVSVGSTGFGQVASGTCTPTANDCQFLFYTISSTRFVGMDGSGSNPNIQPADQ